MVRKIFVVILLSMCSTMGLAQESDYISTANLKFKQIDEFILEGDINKVCELQNEILLFVDKIEDSETRFLIYDIAINKYITAKCYKEAITLSKRAVDKARDRFGPKHKEVAELLYLLGFSYAHNRQIRLAIEYGNQSVQMYEDLKEIEGEPYLMAVIMLNQYYGENHQYPEGIEMLRRSLKLMESYEIPSERLAIVYRAIATSYSDLNIFTMAQIYTIKALHLYKDKMSVNYWRLKQNLAWLYDNYAGTEESFKKLSGKTISTLHIATHGFYFNEDESNFYDFFRDMNIGVKQGKGISTLLRSGLMLSGGQHAWLHGRKDIPQDKEDGILLASEISLLDFHNVDLVTLSACQTGLGDISDDGVMGLQRGFKRAGVNSILMTLWPVNDYATRLFMGEFYRNLVSGQTKLQSLHLAQKYLRESNVEYNNPYYWAAFILLDDLKQ